MTKHLKIFLLTFSRNRAYSVINILGLSTGIACSILILLWVTDELSFDRYHKNAEQIYRIVGDDVTIGKTAQTCGALGEYMKENYPEIVKAARFMPYGGSPFKYDDKLFMIEKGAFADPAFLQMFSFNFISGDPQNALNDLSNIVITESMSKKFFGDEKPLGKVIHLDGKSPMVISAVISDPPANSQIQFAYLLNTGILKYIGIPIDDWSSSLLYTFIQVQSNTDIQKLNSQISNLMRKHIPGFDRKLFLQPLTDIHLNTEFISDFAELGDKKYVYIFSSIALFLILIACINYINLSTARVLKRSKEIGLRKIMGSTRLQLIGNYLFESFLFVTVSFIIAVVLTEVFLPVFNQVSGKAISLNYSDISFWIKIIVLLIIVSLLAGGYPALILSSVKPIVAIKNILTERPRGPLLRKTLVVIQFSFTIMLIVATTIVYNQLNFIKNKKLGFDKENIIYFKAKGKFQQDYGTMKNELLSHSSIIEVTAEDQLLTSGLYKTNNVGWEGKDEKNDLHIDFAYVDYNYFNMLNVQLKEGRNFSEEMGSDQNAFILNEEAVNQMKIKQPVAAGL